MNNNRLSPHQASILEQLKHGPILHQEWRTWNQIPIFWLHFRGLVYLRVDLALTITREGRNVLSDYHADPKKRNRPDSPTFIKRTIPRRRRATRVSHASA